MTAAGVQQPDEREREVISEAGTVKEPSGCVGQNRQAAELC
jgi:hypothetical protein